jgi:hypothetical protein
MYSFLLCISCILHGICNMMYRHLCILGCMHFKKQGCLYIMLHMPCQMQEKHKGKLYKCYKGTPTDQLKKSNKHQAPPANEWIAWSLGVWWKYRLVGHMWVHGSRLSSLSLRCLSENDTSLLCSLFWNGALGSLRRLWHWCYHIEVGHGYSPHQSHSWCMWYKGAESNN